MPDYPDHPGIQSGRKNTDEGFCAKAMKGEWGVAAAVDGAIKKEETELFYTFDPSPSF